MLRSQVTLLRCVAGGAALLLFVAVFWVPFHVAVAPTLSVSYETGFNNHAALLFFLAGCGLLCVATDGTDALAGVQGRRLRRYALAAAVVCSTALAVAWRVRREHKPLGLESGYLINRQIQMAHGARLYRDLEFIYGPLLAFPELWLQQLTHLSAVHAYMAVWTALWALGTAMLWYTVAKLELPVRHPVLIFAFLYGMALTLLRSEGVQYTPFRVDLAAFLAVTVSAVWRRTHAAYTTAGLMAACIAFAFAVSPEQGFGVALGFSAYALLLSATERRRFPWAASALVLCAAGGSAALAARSGELHAAAGFARGGQNFPLLPSPLNCLLLATYAAGLLVLYRALRTRDWDNMAIPLGMCGLPMLTSAFGRCDVEHLSSAVPLYLLGLVWIVGQRWPLRLWIGSVAALVLVLGGFLDAFLPHRRAASTGSATVAAAQAISPAVSQFRPIPEGPRYFAPLQVPTGSDGQPRWQAQSGFFYGIQNLLTEQDVLAKVTELRSRHSAFLLLPDTPGDSLKTRFWAPEEDIEVVRRLEGSAWVPRLLRPLPYVPLLNKAIETMYQPTDFAEAGWRVWRLRTR